MLRPVVDELHDRVEVVHPRLAELDLARARWHRALAQHAPHALDCAFDRAWPRAARRAALLERGADGELGVDVAVRARRLLADHFDREFLERGVGLDRLADESPRLVMRLAEGDAEPHEVVGEIGGVRVALGGRKKRVLAVDRDPSDHRRQDAQAHRQLPHRIEERLLVFLQVLVVGHGQALHGDEQRDEVADLAAGLAAEELERVWVLLLRHERAAGGERVRQLDERGLARRVEDEVLGETREVDGAQRARRQRLDHEVAVADGVERVRGRRAETEVLRELLAVDRVRRACERPRPERRRAHALERIRETLGVAAEHLDIRQAPVREQDRLRALEVRVARERRRLLALGEVDERVHRGLELGLAQLQLPRGPEPQVGGDLVVAAAARVQLLAEVADAGDELALDPRVDILVGGVDDRARVILRKREDLRERSRDLALFVLGDHPHAHDCLRPCDRALDILAHERSVERKRVVELAEERVGLAFEAPCPDGGRHVSGPSASRSKRRRRSKPSWRRRCWRRSSSRRGSARAARGS